MQLRRAPPQVSATLCAAAAGCCTFGQSCGWARAGWHWPACPPWMAQCYAGWLPLPEGSSEPFSLLLTGSPLGRMISACADARKGQNKREEHAPGPSLLNQSIQGCSFQQAASPRFGLAPVPRHSLVESSNPLSAESDPLAMSEAGLTPAAASAGSGVADTSLGAGFITKQTPLSMRAGKADRLPQGALGEPHRRGCGAGGRAVQWLFCCLGCVAWAAGRHGHATAPLSSTAQHTSACTLLPLPPSVAAGSLCTPSSPRARGRKF